ncbi:ATP-binding protein [Adhaeribacter aquaticus]|uniref:ATP-binding protein n=1 Tax=Adhaeribacter aquaticus TaxID=299567 RepID=UPI00040D6525|nr:ATP-binding protein [Adhaeribacter aquaticus]
MKLITKIYVSVGLILITFVSSTIIYFQQNRNVITTFNQTLQSAEIIKSTLNIYRAVINAQVGLRGYLLTSNENFLDSFYEGQADYLIEINLLKKRCKDNPNYLKTIKEIEIEFLNWNSNISEPIIEAKRNFNSSPESRIAYDKLYDSAYNKQTAKISIDKIKGKLKNIEKSEIGYKNQLVNELQNSLEFTDLLGLALTIFALIIGIITTIVLGKTITRRINSMKKVARNLAQENFEVNLTDNYHDELSGLEASMNVMAKKLQKSFMRLNKMNQELDQFAYVVSHDLKAPLRAINNLAEWIKEDIGEVEDPEIKQNLDLMRGRVHRMENLINGILEYARVGRKKLDKVTINVQDILLEIVDSLAIPSHIQVILPETNVLLTTEKILLQQVLANLIGNGIKYNDKPAGVVQVAIQEKAKEVEIAVSDNGPGIPQEFHSRIFGVFQTIEARDTKESTGIGLAIVKKIIEDKGGKIWLDSEVGVGTTFYFTWPVKSSTEVELLSNSYAI